MSHNTKISEHKVKSTDVKPINNLESTNTRDILIKTEDGTMLKITLFSEDEENLEVNIE